MKPLCDYCLERQNDKDFVSVQRFRLDENGYVVQSGEILTRKCKRCHKKSLNEYLYADLPGKTNGFVDKN